MNEDYHPWLSRIDQQATLRLFCFPAAGFGASQYRGWPAAFGPGVDICAVQLPGREKRIDEAPLRDLLNLATRVADAIVGVCDRPYALFGHSLGALMAFEVARALRGRCRGELVGLFPAAHPAPHIPCRSNPEFERVRIPSDLDPELAEELARLVRPALDADTEMRLTYKYQQGPLLDCPMMVIGAADNPEISEEDLSEWRHHTQDSCQRLTVPGDHFFVHDARRELAEAIQGVLGIRPRRAESVEEKHVANDS